VRRRLPLAGDTPVEGDAVKGRAGWRVLALGLFLVFMLVPLLATVLFSVSTRWDRTIWPEGYTVRWWQAVTARSASGTRC